MKTNKLLSILLLAVSMVSCTTYYQVKTRIHPDFRFFKIIRIF